MDSGFAFFLVKDALVICCTIVWLGEGEKNKRKVKIVSYFYVVLCFRICNSCGNVIGWRGTLSGVHVSTIPLKIQK